MDDLREFLESARWAHAKAARLSRKVEDLETQVLRITPAYTGMPRGGGGDISAPWVTLAQLRADYIEEKVRAERLEKEVADFVDSLPTPEFREVLYLRYCERLRWPEVVKRMSTDGLYYSDRHVFRLHGRALNEAREKWKEKKDEESRDS